MAKMARERKVQERRELKQEKKLAAAAERLAKAAGTDPAAEAVDSPISDPISDQTASNPLQ
jgi:hypothetical protein